MQIKFTLITFLCMTRTNDIILKWESYSWTGVSQLTLIVMVIS